MESDSKAQLPPSDGTTAAPARPARATPAFLRRALTIRDAPGWLEGALWGAGSLLLVLLVWCFLTLGEGDWRILDAYTLPSPVETFRSIPDLWFKRELSISAVTSLARVLGGFILATAVAVPLGVISGSYLRVNAFLKPLSLFGRNVPVAALIPITLIWFGLGEVQKVMFIFLATVMFVLFDTTNAVLAVPDRFLDTGYTLGTRATLRKGARLAALLGLAYGVIAAIGWLWLSEDPTATLAREVRGGGFWLRFAGGFIAGFCLWFPIEGHQVLRKVLFPLALPDIVNSLRLIFGVAFGYIMLAEVINAQHGLGSIIIVSQRQGPREHIYVCLVVISLLAWAIDRLILRLQRHLFPYLKNGSS